MVECVGSVGFTLVLRTLHVLMCERDAKRLVNAVNDGILSSKKDRDGTVPLTKIRPSNRRFWW